MYVLGYQKSIDRITKSELYRVSIGVISRLKSDSSRYADVEMPLFRHKIKLLQRLDYFTTFKT